MQYLCLFLLHFIIYCFSSSISFQALHHPIALQKLSICNPITILKPFQFWLANLKPSYSLRNNFSSTSFQINWEKRTRDLSRLIKCIQNWDTLDMKNDAHDKCKCNFPAKPVSVFFMLFIIRYHFSFKWNWNISNSGKTYTRIIKNNNTCKQ